MVYFRLESSFRARRRRIMERSRLSRATRSLVPVSLRGGPEKRQREPMAEATARRT
jgi:hypothetical protein